MCSEKKPTSQSFSRSSLVILTSSSTVGGLHTMLKLCWLALVDTHCRDPIWLWSSGRFWNGVHNIFFTNPVNCRRNKWGNRLYPWLTPHFRVGGSCGEGFCMCVLHYMKASNFIKVGVSTISLQTWGTSIHGCDQNYLFRLMSWFLRCNKLVECLAEGVLEMSCFLAAQSSSVCLDLCEQLLSAK